MHSEKLARKVDIFMWMLHNELKRGKNISISNVRFGGCMITAKTKVNVFFIFFLHSGFPLGTLHSKFFQKTMILAFEVNSALSCQMDSFTRFSSLCVGENRWLLIWPEFFNIKYKNLLKIVFWNRYVFLIFMHSFRKFDSYENIDNQITLNYFFQIIQHWKGDSLKEK